MNDRKGITSGGEGAGEEVSAARASGSNAAPGSSLSPVASPWSRFDDEWSRFDDEYIEADDTDSRDDERYCGWTTSRWKHVLVSTGLGVVIVGVSRAPPVFLSVTQKKETFFSLLSPLPSLPSHELFCPFSRSPLGPSPSFSSSRS